ncbi:MAG: tetratricopeptide repeat protein [Paludibacteraceae bacterium]|nr:tetratricopeptide repeat protein [Paludibacteraceae bacterium]
MSYSMFGMAQEYRTEAFRKSYAYEESKQYANAINELLSIKTDIYAVDLRLGWLYYLNGDYKNSLLYYAKSIQLRPTSIEARFGYVLPAAKLKAWDKVAAQYDAIIKLDPNNSKANYYRGLMYYNVGEYAKAAPYFDRIENLYPFDYDIVILSAWNCYYLKKIEKAKLLFNQALLIQPSSASALQGLNACK